MGNYLGEGRTYHRDWISERRKRKAMVVLGLKMLACIAGGAALLTLVMGCAAGTHQGSWGIAVGRAEVSANCQYVRESKGDGVFSGGKNEELVEGEDCFRIAGGPLSEGVLSAVLAYFSWGAL